MVFRNDEYFRVRQCWPKVSVPKDVCVYLNAKEGNTIWIMKILIFIVGFISARSFSLQDRFQSDSVERLRLGEDVNANKEDWIEGLSSYRQRRSYSDIEESVGSFLDDVDFYLEKVGIIRYIILDVR